MGHVYAFKICENGWWYFGHMMIKNWLFKAFSCFKSSVIVFAGTQKKNLELGYIKF